MGNIEAIILIQFHLGRVGMGKPGPTAHGLPTSFSISFHWDRNFINLGVWSAGHGIFSPCDRSCVAGLGLWAWSNDVFQEAFGGEVEISSFMAWPLNFVCTSVPGRNLVQAVVIHPAVSDGLPSCLKPHSERWVCTAWVFKDKRSYISRGGERFPQFWSLLMLDFFCLGSSQVAHTNMLAIVKNAFCVDSPTSHVRNCSGRTGLLSGRVMTSLLFHHGLDYGCMWLHLHGPTEHGLPTNVSKSKS